MKYFKFLICTLWLCTSFSSTVFGMHVMEGFLPPLWCVAWAVLAIPFIMAGVKKIGKLLKENSKLAVMLAMAGAFAFVLSALKIPSVTGSSSHMTGLGFAAIMFGPTVASVLGFIVLLFQALLLAHGGLTTLGANVFSMGIIGPIAAFMIYIALSKMNMPKKVAVFSAAALGDLATYVVTSFQLAIAFPSEVGGFSASMGKFLGVFALTQLPLAVVEGILTVVLINLIGAYGRDRLHEMGRGELNYE